MTRARAKTETSAGGVVFRCAPDGPRFLLILDGHGNWGFPKGHVEPGEHPAEAARREVAEEVGLEDLVRHGPLRKIAWFFRLDGRLVHKHCHFFLFESRDGTPVPQQAEGIRACAWLGPEDALRALTHENARQVLQDAVARVQGLCATDPQGASG